MLTIDRGHFRDKQGRTVMLRGVNLGGSSKVPFSPPVPSHVRDGFFDHRNISFVGRPFPADEAREHYRRLRHWGFNCLRFLVTWEAVEHAGPGDYDTDYLDYIEKMIDLAGQYGFYVFIDPHQDVWSRFSGGDGAPGWTLEAAGLDISGFQATGAAIVHNTHGDPFPRMIWPTNYNKLAAATMFTLFFGGDKYAPLTSIDGVPIQQYLQQHYLDAMVQVARRVKHMPHVLGFDTLNEPSPGYLGNRDLRDNFFFLRQGDAPSPWQSMQLASGHAAEVEVWGVDLTGMRKRGTRVIDPGEERAWLPGRECIWRQHGVWDVREGSPVLLRPDYFADADFGRQHMNPFISSFAAAIRKEVPRAIIFAEHEVMGKPEPMGREETKDFVYAPHWYDPLTLTLKRYVPWLTVDSGTQKLVLGRKKVRQSFARQLWGIKTEGQQAFPDAPTLIGETGIAFDLNNARAYRDGDFNKQILALDRTFNALEANLLHYTLWNYTADNTNKRGDNWNGEDLSLFSRDQQQDPGDPNSGGRALKAFLRPHPRAVAGIVQSMSFDCFRGIFELEVESIEDRELQTEIYIPAYHFPRGLKIEGDGSWQYDEDNQLLLWTHWQHKKARLVLKPGD